MRVFNDLNELPTFKNAVLTIGSFDGVHQGHQLILKKVMALAKKFKGESVLITFHPHPRQIIFPKDNSLRLISTVEEKLALFKKMGLDNVVVVPFTVEFSQLSADEYVRKFLVERFKPKYIVIGYDHRFGLNRQGDINYLKWHGKAEKFKVIEIGKHTINKIAISSTKIRTALEEGNVREAASFLNHYFTLTGTVVKGQQIGNTIGFPTANIEIPNKHKLIPPDGIYACFVNYKEEVFKGMMYIGNRPVLKQHDNKTIEVNIFDFKKDIYGDKLKLEIVSFIRADQNFESLDQLKEALQRDKISALEILDKEEKRVIEEKEVAHPSVAVVILNYNGEEVLKQFLPSVLESDYPNLEIIVADNGSGDSSLEMLKEEFPEVKIIDLEENNGFAKGYNLAMETVVADYYVLLNSDVEVSGNWIMPIIELMEKDKTIGAAQPKIKSYNDKESFEYAGAAGGWIDHWGYPFCKGRIIATVEKDVGQYDQTEEIFWASGAAFFVRAHLFNALEGFDADYFAHMEEIDLCWRIKKAGFKIIACPSSVVYHIGGKTLDYQSPHKTYLNFRNTLYTILKNEPLRKLLWLIPLRLCLDGAAGILFLFQGKVKHIRAIIKAHWTFYPQMSKFYKKRYYYNDLIQKVSINLEPNNNGILKKSIVIEYYLKGKKIFSRLQL